MSENRCSFEEFDLLSFLPWILFAGTRKEDGKKKRKVFVRAHAHVHTYTQPAGREGVKERARERRL